VSDPVTILGISALSAILSLIVMGSLARSHIPGAQAWCWANAFLLLGDVLVMGTGHLPAFFCVVCANASLGAATTFQLIGLRRFYGHDTRYGVMAAVVGLMTIAIAYFKYVDDSFSARVLVFSVYHAALSFALGFTVWRHWPRERPKYAYCFMIGMTFTITTINVLRGMVFLLGVAPNSSPMTATPWHMAFLAIGTMAAPTLTIGMVMMVHDRMSAALEKHANIDYLTELLGRRAFMETAAKERDRAARFGRPLSVAVVDIDFFKQINDHYGHAGGDEVLAHFASLLSTTIRSNDISGRIGGEEFAVLLLETKAYDAFDVLERLRQRLRTTPGQINHGRQPMGCTFSAGIAQLQEDETLDALIERADKALYQAKQRGRDQTVVHGPGLASSTKDLLCVANVQVPQTQ
jgi:diguanylate cyclase (GGDEF)-like protein